MCKRIVVLAVLGAMAGRAADARATLLGAWTFDEQSGSTAFDQVGAHDARVEVGADYPDFRLGNYPNYVTPAAQPMSNIEWMPEGGVFGGAIDLDGQADFPDLGDKTTWRPFGDALLVEDSQPFFSLTGPITVAAWIKITLGEPPFPLGAHVYYRRIVTKGEANSWQLRQYYDPSSSLGTHWGLTVSGQNTAPYGPDDGVSLWHMGPTDTNGTPLPGGPFDGEWHHVVAIFDATYDGAAGTHADPGKTLMYFDNELVTTGRAAAKDAWGSIATNSANVLIGGVDGNRGTGWLGMLDEIGIWDEVLDPATIDQIYNNGLVSLGVFKCDYDKDGDMDVSDINQLLDNLSGSGKPASDPKYDLDADNDSDQEDVTRWLQKAGQKYGDWNFDGTVDLADFNLWLNGDGSGGWSGGDGNGDASNDLMDFNMWLTESAPTLSGMVLSPEPATLVLLSLGGLLLPRRRC